MNAADQLLEIAGLKAVFVEGLNREAWLVKDAGVVLFDDYVTPERMDELVTELLHAEFDTELQP